MSRRSWVYINGEAVERVREDNTGHYVQGDIAPYKSMIDGTMIEGRAQHRDHLRQHNCIEVGNEEMHTKIPAVKNTRRERLVAQLDGMTNAQADKILRQLRETVRFHNPHRER